MIKLPISMEFNFGGSKNLLQIQVTAWRTESGFDDFSFDLETQGSKVKYIDFEQFISPEQKNEIITIFKAKAEGIQNEVHS